LVIDRAGIQMLTIDDVAARCDKVRWSNKHSFLACCLAHDDRNPSMSVTEAEDGRLLVHCHSGCTQSELLDAIGFKDGIRPLAVPKQIQRPVRREVKPTFNYAVQLWESCNTDNPFIHGDEHVGTHPYSVKKKIRGACGAGRGTASGRLLGKDKDCVIIPMRSLDGSLTGVEVINADGVKQTFGSKGILILGNDLNIDHPIIVFEGWASACGWLNIRNGDGCAVACFGKGTAEKAAQKIQAHYLGHVVLVGREHD
jgi:hypothetical protein